MTPVRCQFHVRTPADGGWYYDHVRIAGPESDGDLHTTYPPAVGDLIFLWDAFKRSGGRFRVVGRDWLHAGWGSTYWPYTERQSTVGPELQLIVEPADGLFVDQVLRPEDEDEDTNGGDHG